MEVGLIVSSESIQTQVYLSQYLAFLPFLYRALIFTGDDP